MKRFPTQLIRRQYHRLYDEILFRRGVKFHGTALATYRDLDMYVTQAAFCQLQGQRPPKAMDRRGGLPWFADIQEASRIAQRSHPLIPDNFWDLLVGGLPDHFLEDPTHVVHCVDVGTNRNDKGRFSFLLMEIQSISELFECVCAENGRMDIDRLEPIEQSQLKYWAGQWSRANEDRSHLEGQTDTRILATAYQAEPDHPRFKEEILLTAALLDDTPVWLTEFRKDRSESFYRIALVAFQEPSAPKKTRLAAHVARELELFLIHLNHERRDLCLDFIGSITPKAAIMGHSLFRRLVSEKLKDLQKLTPEDYEVLYTAAQTYSYPTFKRAEIVTSADMLREIGKRIKGKLTRHANHSP